MRFGKRSYRHFISLVAAKDFDSVRIFADIKADVPLPERIAAL